MITSVEESIKSSSMELYAMLGLRGGDIKERNSHKKDEKNVLGFSS